MTVFKNTSQLLNSLNIYINTHKKKIQTQLYIICLIVLEGFIEWGLFYWMNDKDMTKIKTSQGILFIIFLFIFFVEFIFLIGNLSAYTYWICAKKWGGIGSFTDTCIALLWTMAYSLVPFGFFYTLIQFDKSLGNIIHGFSCIALVVTVIVGIVSMSRKISKLHGLRSNQGVSIFLLGTLIQLPIQLLIIALTISNLRTILIVTIPLSMQILTTLAIITIGHKALKKLNKAGY